jgi:hypothetical protein
MQANSETEFLNPRKEQISFPALSEDLYEDLRFFSIEILQALRQVSIPFKATGNVCPVHCKKALNVLDHLNEQLAIGCQSLRRSVSLAILLAPSRYSLLIDLCCIQEDASQLMNQLDDYRISCLKSSRRLTPRRCEIMTLFDKVMRQLEDIPGLITSLEKDIEVQEQRLSTIIE